MRFSGTKFPPNSRWLSESAKKTGPGWGWSRATIGQAGPGRARDRRAVWNNLETDHLGLYTYLLLELNTWIKLWLRRKTLYCSCSSVSWKPDNMQVNSHTIGTCIVCVVHFHWCFLCISLNSFLKSILYSALYVLCQRQKVIQKDLTYLSFSQLTIADTKK